LTIQGNPSTQPKKTTVVELNSSLLANQVFLGSWHDSQADGTNYVAATVYASAASTNGGFIIQESDDITNANFTRTVSNLTAIVSANTLTRVQGVIKARFWRISYTNNVAAAASIEITSCATNVFLQSQGSSGGNSDTTDVGPVVVITTNNPNQNAADNVTSVNGIPNGVNNSVPVSVANEFYGGAFSGTANATLQGWSKARTPTVFKRITVTATGSTAIWTPGTGNKFRLLAYRIQITADSTLAVAGRLTVSLLDSAADIAQDLVIAVPAAGLTVGDDYDSGWTQLGNFGILSAAANNALNVNLSAALTNGLVNVIVAGVEE
jgi:hypothetical protein